MSSSVSQYNKNSGTVKGRKSQDLIVLFLTSLNSYRIAAGIHRYCACHSPRYCTTFPSYKAARSKGD